MAHDAHAPAADRPYVVPSSVRNLAIGLLVLGLAGLGMAFAGDAWRAWANVLIGAYYFTGIALGAAFIFAVYSMVNAGWWVVIKRPVEAFTTFLPVGLIAFLAIGLFGLHSLYEWSIPEIVAHDHLLQRKSVLLNESGWLMRVVIYFGIWMTTTFLMRRNSRAQDADASIARTGANVKLGAIHLVFFALTITFAGLDWMSSLEPHWFSTMFGVYQFIGLFVGAAAWLTLFVLGMKKAGYLAYVNENHYHDLGKMMFAFATFWAYIWVSQYMLIWYSNIPEETTYYMMRQNDGWQYVWALNPLVRWVIPFLVLLPRNNKRNQKVLIGVALLLVFGHWLDIYLQVMPAVSHFAAHHHGAEVHGPFIGLQEVGGWAFFAGLFLLIVPQMMTRAPLLAQNDPYLDEALHHDQ